MNDCQQTLKRLLRPRSIAVFGGREAANVIRQCDKMGFPGEIWPVHPYRDVVEGRKCYHSVAALPRSPDVAFIGVNRHATVDIVRELAARGSGGAVVYASGFAEINDDGEEGLARQTRLVEAAGDMPVLGPNCYGFVNYLDGLPLWPDQHGGVRVERGVAIVTQSSNISINLTMQRRGLPIAYVVTVGNQANTDLPTVARGLLADGRVTAIGLHIEGIKNVPAFEEMVGAARARGIPVVALKPGRSKQARAATLSHTASMAGSDAGSSAFLRRLGVPRVSSVPQFLETLKLLHVHGPLPGRAIGSMSCSGGEAALVADAAEGRGVYLRPLSDEQRMRVRATLDNIVTISNPLDYHTFIWGRREPLSTAFTAMLGCEFDLTMLVLDFPRLDRCDDSDWNASADALKYAAKETGARVALVASMAENLPETRALELLDSGIAPMFGIDETMIAAEAAAFIGEAWRHPESPAPVLVTPQSGTEPRVLYEMEAKRRLNEYGLPIPAGRIVTDPADAMRAAEAIGYPVAVKVSGVSHKTDVGGVRLGLRDADAVGEAVRQLAAQGTELLVEHMVEDAVAELVVGVTRDAQFGLLMTLGAGGVLVEVLGDTASLLLPATNAELYSALESLKIAPLLHGSRGKPPADLEAAVQAIAAVARFAEANAGRLAELDVNPLLVRPVGGGAVAVDALLVMKENCT